MSDKKYTYQDLVQIIEVLRSENGCPWDREQTHESLIPHVLEESYEVVEAIQNKDTANLKEELGDLLLQVLLHAQIGKEASEFDIEDVVDGIAKKLVFRHPHVFTQDVEASTTEQVLNNWEELKKQEKSHTTEVQGMESIAKSLPALMRAYKVQKKAAKVGFFWDTYEPIVGKIAEELEEVRQEAQNQNSEALEEEIGDLLFSMVNLCYFFEINPEFALTNGVEKFINRFRYIENSALARGKRLSQMTLDEMDVLWNEAKRS